MIRIWLAYIDALDTPFDPELHCDPANAGFTMVFTQDEGGVAQVTIERKQLGWAIMHPDAPRFALISESATGDPADAVVIARGRITGIPDDLFEPTQTFDIICGPENLYDVGSDAEDTVDGPLLTWAKANLAEGPETCFLLEDADRDDPASYVLGRSQTYHFDPATHEISVSEFSDGPLVNMSRSHIHDEEKGIKPTMEWTELPVAQVRITAKAPWTQVARGVCDVAPAINTAGASPYIYTCSPDFTTSTTRELPNGLMDFELGAGWEIADSMLLMKEGLSASFFSGREGTLTLDVYAPPNPNFQVQRVHKEIAALKQWRFQLLTLWMRYDLQQQREETVTAVVTMPIQALPGVEKELDAGEVSTVDLIADPDAVPYEPGEWDEGTRTEFGGRIYQCNEDHDSHSFYQLKPGQVIWNGYELAFHPYWDLVSTNAPLEASASEFFTTPIGREVMAHLVLRGRRRLLDRARALRITLTYPWRLARAITLKDMVRVQVPWPDGTTRAIKGKVVRIEKNWAGVNGAMINVTIAVSLGTGTNGATAAGIQPTYGNPDNYMSAMYLRELGDEDDPQETFGVAGDTEYIVDADRTPRPVHVPSLASPHYAVTKVIRRNEANEQVALAIQRANAVLDPTIAVQKKPTRIGTRMRNLAAEGVMQRDIYIAAEVLASPRGIDLVNGAEP